MTLLKAGRPSSNKKDKAISSVQETSEEQMKMSINIQKKFHKQIKQCALDNDTTVTEIVTQALKDYMRK
jgi:hypothetical protein